jgi:hypothetical protein
MAARQRCSAGYYQEPQGQGRLDGWLLPGALIIVSRV